MAALKDSKKVVDPQKLSRGDDTKFSSVVTCYERKDYKKGHRLCDEILKRSPDHGETQAMKGLLFNCQQKKDEAYEMVKLGLKNNIRSHVCWHVYGLIYRSDRNYKEAIKCYLNALRINKGNQGILRDLSWLQIQLRDYDAFISTRRTILTGKPNIRSNWIAAAMAHYHAKDYGVAYEVIAKANTLKQEEPVGDYEWGELLLLQNACLEKQGLYQKALDHLKENENKIVDKLGVNVKRAEVLTLLGLESRVLARDAWLALLDDEPENYRYHTGLQTVELGLDAATAAKMFALTKTDLPCTVLALTDAQRAQLVAMYDGNPALTANKYGAIVIRKIKFSLLDGEALKAELEKHIKLCLSRGLPALYHDVCAAVLAPSTTEQGRVYQVTQSDEFRSHTLVLAVMQIVDDQISSLRQAGCLTGPSEAGKKQPPTALLWALYLKCHLHEVSGELDKALLYINEALEHTPTATDIFLKKARVLKKMGQLKAAASVADEGRALDLQDRYLNNKAAKYHLRADLAKEGFDLMSMFTRYEADPQQYLADMQCNWFELEAGDSFSRQKQWGQALKKYYSVLSHFTDYIEDMFDFHGFCVRKVTLRAHSNALSMQDEALQHPYFQRATAGALSVLLHLLDDPEDHDGLGHLTAKDRKKEREKRKKAKAKELKAEEEKAKKAIEEAEWMGNSAPPPDSKDKDPYGEAILAKSHSDEAYSWAMRLLPHLPSCSSEILSLVAEVMIRRSKPVLALKVLDCGFRTYPKSPPLTAVLVRFAMRLNATTTKSTKPLSKNATVMTFVKRKLTEAHMLGTPGCTKADVDTFVTALKDQVASAAQSDKANKHYDDLVARMSLSRCLVYLRGERAGAAEVEADIFPLAFMERALADENGVWCNVRVQALAAALTALTDPRGQFKLGDNFKAGMRASILQKYPKADFGVLQGDTSCVEDLDDLPALEKV